MARWPPWDNAQWNNDKNSLFEIEVRKNLRLCTITGWIAMFGRAEDNGNSHCDTSDLNQNESGWLSPGTLPANTRPVFFIPPLFSPVIKRLYRLCQAPADSHSFPPFSCLISHRAHRDRRVCIRPHESMADSMNDPAASAKIAQFRL